MLYAEEENLSDVSISEIHECDLEELQRDNTYFYRESEGKSTMNSEIVRLSGVEVGSLEGYALPKHINPLSPPPTGQRDAKPAQPRAEPTASNCQQSTSKTKKNVRRLELDLNRIMASSLEAAEPPLTDRAPPTHANLDSDSKLRSIQIALTKQELEAARLRRENESLQAHIRTLQAEVEALQEKVQTERRECAASLKAEHAREIDFLVEKYTAEQSDEVSQLRQRYKKDLESTADRLRRRFEESLAAVKRAHQLQESEMRQQHGQEIATLRSEISDKESIFVNNLSPNTGKQTELLTLTQKCTNLEDQVSSLRQTLAGQREKLLDRMRKKYREYLEIMKSSFQIERERMKLRHERDTNERIQSIKNRYQMRYSKAPLTAVGCCLFTTAFYGNARNKPSCLGAFGSVRHGHGVATKRDDRIELL